MIETAIPENFDKSTDSVGQRILMDGCPNKNSKTALKAPWDFIALVFKILPHLSDLKPFKNFFSFGYQNTSQASCQRQHCQENIWWIYHKGARNNAELHYCKTWWDKWTHEQENNFDNER